MGEHALQEALKLALETWRFQIDSYWSRNSYFAAFHSAIMAAVWDISKTAVMQRKVALQGFCYAGMFLALLWLFNNLRLHQYVRYWWCRAASIEKELNLPESISLVQGFDYRRPSDRIPGEYHVWMNSIPVLFLGIWLVIRFVCF